MKGLRRLVTLGVRTVRRSMLWWSVGTVTFIVVNLAFWPSLEESGALEGYEDMEAFMEAFGAQNINTPSGYLDGQVFAMLVPLLLSAMMIAIVSGTTSGDESAGRLELLHALPISRREVWLARWSSAMVLLAVVGAMSGLATIVSLPLFSLTEVPVSRVVGATLGSMVLGAFHGAITYVAAARGAGRGLSAGVGIVVLVVGYLMSYVFPISSSLAFAEEWSPWYWALGDQPVSNGVSLPWELLVVAITTALVAIGTILIDHRDIRTA